MEDCVLGTGTWVVLDWRYKVCGVAEAAACSEERPIYSGDIAWGKA